jgi:hypothetical protein
MSKVIIDTFVSFRGNEVNIYEVSNENVNKDSLKEGSIYEVTYKFGERGSETITSKYMDCTDSFRTLRFEHPTKGDRYSLHIPFNNILSIHKVY